MRPPTRSPWLALAPLLGALFGCAKSAATATPPAAVPHAETVRYCAGTVTEWEVHHCIWELTPEQQRRRPYSQRLTYRNGVFVRYETISASGNLVPGTLASTYRYESGGIVAWAQTDARGVLRGYDTLSEGRALVLWTDELRRPRVDAEKDKDSHVSGLRRVLDARGRVASYTYVDGQGTPTAHGKIFGVKRERNAQGAVLSESYFGAQGEPVAPPNGAARVVYTVDEHGLDLERCYFDAANRPASVEGAHCVRTRHDDVGNPVETAYFDQQGKPALSSAEGAAVVRHERDERGNEIWRKFFDEQGRPVVGKQHYASRRIRYDERDLPIETASFGPDGAALAPEDSGAAVVSETRDEWGNVVRTRYFDADARPVRCKNGYYSVETTYDSRNNPILYSYTDVTGAPVIVSQGYQARRHQYDGDRLIRTEYLDAAGKPVDTTWGYSRSEVSYAADGSRSATGDFDLNGTPVEECHGTLTQELRDEITHRAMSTDCFVQFLAAHPNGAGRIFVNLHVGEPGAVTRAVVVRDELHDATLSSCFLDAFKPVFQHPPTGGCVSFPIVMKPNPPTTRAPPKQP
jgi:hypothetical protein